MGVRLVRFGRRIVDLGSRTVSSDDPPAHLSPREARLLRYLVERLGQLVSREELLAEVWDYQPGVLTRTIDNTVRRLRVKLEDDPSDPRFLHSRYGRGLVLEGAEGVDADTLATSFVGRQETTARILALLQTERLVTLTGPAGVGKTRLAAELAARLSTVVVRVSCAGLAPPADLDHRLLDALEASENPVQVLRARSPLVLWLDECETATSAVSERVVAWTTAVPGLRVLVTSRVALGVPIEQVVGIDPLAVEAAAALFTERLARRDPRFPAEPAAIRRIVASLDGLPLAVELAAARAPAIGLDELESLLASPLDALAVQGRSLADVLERSWTLCSDRDRRMLALLSVFAAPFTLADLAGVTGLGELEAASALDGLTTQSLLTVVAGRPLRYRLLAAIRERAARDLPPDDPVHARHAWHFASLGDPERLERSFADPAMGPAVGAAISDLARALERLLPVDPDAAARCVLAMLWWFARRGANRQGLGLPDRLRVPPSSDRLVAAIAIQHAVVLVAAGRLTQAAAELEEALQVAGDPFDQTGLWTALAGVRFNLGDAAGVAAALAGAERHADRARGALPRYLLRRAVLSSAPPPPGLLERALAAAREYGAVGTGALVAGEIADRTHLRSGDWAAARRAYHRVLHEIGPTSAWYDPPTTRHALTSLGRLEQLIGDLEAAESWLDQALEVENVDETIVARLILARVKSQAGRQTEALALVEPVTDGSLLSPKQPLALGCIVHAECLLRAERPDLATPWLRRAEALVTPGGWQLLEAEVHDLLGVVEGDPARLDRAAGLDPTAIGAARRQAMLSLVLARSERVAEARVTLAAARARMAELGLGRDADAMQWADRAGRRLRH